MDLLLGEHGETLLYGIVGTMTVVIICLICSLYWGKLMPGMKSTLSKSNNHFIENNSGKYPTITVDETIYASYGIEGFNYKDFIEAFDCNGNDITDKVDVYGEVDVFKKGVYKIRCVVVDENKLTCTKYASVIVE